MKKYTFKVVIHEGCDEFWESLEGKTGCDPVTEMIKEALEDFGLFVGDNCEITLTQYNEDA